MKEKLKLTFVIAGLMLTSLLMIFLVFNSDINQTALANNEQYKADGEFVNSLDYLHNNGLTKYNEVDDFRPGDILTREQAAKFFSEYAEKELGLEQQKNIKCEFEDISSSDPTLKDHILKSCKLGLFKGYNNKFHPKDVLTKAEALTVLIRAKHGMQDETSDPRFYNYFKKAKEEGLTKETDYRKLDNRISRYEASLIIYRDKSGGIKSVQTKDGNISYVEEEYAKTQTVSIKLPASVKNSSLEDNIKIYPEVDYDYKVENGNELILILEKQIEDTNYVLNIDEDTELENGGTLGETIVKEFKTEGINKVIFVSPDGLVSEKDKAITVKFSKPITKLTTLDNQKPCPINIVPELPGKCIWITTSTFQYFPEGGYPKGGRFDITIPSGIESAYGDKTVNSANFEITTPKFQIISKPSNISKDEPIIFSFNDKVDLDKFKENFAINGYYVNNINFEYYGDEDGNLVENTVKLTPKIGDWGYGKSFSYTISGNLTSDRGNIPLGVAVSGTVQVQDLLVNYAPAIFINKDSEEPIHTNNLRQSDNKSIILPNNPMIMFEFYEEVEIDKTLFEGINAQFSLRHIKENNCETGTCKTTENKKKLLLQIDENNLNSLNLLIKLSNISSTNDKSLTFKTKEKNKILDFKFVDYYTQCITFQNELGTNQIGQYVDIDKYGTIDYAYKVNKYSRNGCKYEEGKNIYQVRSRLNPETDYNIVIKNSLYDSDNYGLDKDYNYEFKTNVARNEDKNVSLSDNRKFIQIPTDLNPLNIGIQTINLEQVNVEVCEGDFDVDKEGFITNKKCKNKTINIEDLGFRTNFSVVNLNNIYGEIFKSDLVYVKVSKLSKDKVDTKNNYYDPNSSDSTYLRSDLNVLFKGGKENKYLWITDYTDGSSIENGLNKIKLYSKEAQYGIFGDYKGEKGKYISNVIYEYKGEGVYSLNSPLNGSYNDFLLLEMNDGKQFVLELGYINDISDPIFTYIQTDRPLYKVGDTVKIKGISKIFKPNGFMNNSGQDIIYITDPNYGNKKSENISINSNGGFESEFEIGEDFPLGTYRVSIEGGYTTFLVEEYEKPDFEVSVDSDNDLYQYGESANISVKANYFIGSPVSNGNGKYSLSSSAYHFDGGKTEGYIWGDNQYGFFYKYWESSYDSHEQTIEGNTQFILNSSGEEDLNIKLTNNSGYEVGDKTYNIAVTVEDPQTKKTISKNHQFKVVNSKEFVGMKFDSYYYTIGGNAKVDIITVDKEGNPIGNKDISFKVIKNEYTYNEETFRYEESEKELYKVNTKTGNNGKTNIEYEIKDSGSIKFLVSINDEKYITSRTFYISHNNLINPIESNHELSLAYDQRLYGIGETASIVIQSPYDNAKAFISLEKSNGILEYDIIDIKSNNQSYIFKVEKEHAPNVFVKVYLVNNAKLDETSLSTLSNIRTQMRDIEQELFSGSLYGLDYRCIITYDLTGRFCINDPEMSDLDKEKIDQLAELRKQEGDILQKIIPDYLIGEANIRTKLDKFELTTNTTTDKNMYEPGDSVEIELSIEDNEGNPINGEATVAIVDKALLTLKGKENNSLIDFFFSDKSNYVNTTTSLKKIIKRLEFTEDITYEEELEGRGGGIMMEKSMNAMELGDMSSDDYAVMDEAEASAPMNLGAEADSSEKIRQEFKDLAFYKGTIQVNNGKATLNIPKLPDDLTTWVIDGIVFTNDTKVGNFTSEFKTNKKIMVLPSIPRFFMAGDNAIITANIFNNTDTTKNVQVKLDYTNISLNKDNNTKTISIDANSNKKVEWNIIVDGMSEDIEWGNHNAEFIIRASDLEDTDTIKVSKEILPYSTPEYTFTNGSTKDTSYMEIIELPNNIDKTQGRLDISIGASILTNLTDNLTGTVNMPYWNLYSQISQAYRSAQLKLLFTKIGDIDTYNAIKLIGFNEETIGINELTNKIAQGLGEFQQNDGGFSYRKDCVTYNYYFDTCSDYNLTLSVLNTIVSLREAGFEVSESISTKALSYVKKELSKRFDDPSRDYDGLEDLYIISKYGESEYVKNNLKNNYDKLDNISKLYLALVLNKISGDTERLDNLLREITNDSIIEARGTFIPSQYNIKSTILGLILFSEAGEVDSLINENYARRIVHQKRENGYFGSFYDNAMAIEAINKYIDQTGEINNVDFIGGVYKEDGMILTGQFTKENVFETIHESFDLWDILDVGDNNVSFGKKGSGKLYYDMGMKYFLPVDSIKPNEYGMTISRSFFELDSYEQLENKCYSFRFWDSYRYCEGKDTSKLEKVKSGNQGEYIVGEITLVLPQERRNVYLESYIPAGAEIINSKFDTVGEDIKNIEGEDGSNWYSRFDHVEIKDEKLTLYSDYMQPGTYKYTFVIKLNHKGKYHLRPTHVEEMKKPEIWGRTEGDYFEIK